jgi:hypothetical protein
MEGSYGARVIIYLLPHVIKVSKAPFVSSQQLLHLTKTMLLKSKNKTLVFVVALDETDTNLTALGKSIGLKELRFASEELIRDVLGGADKNTGMSLLLF